MCRLAVLLLVLTLTQPAQVAAGPNDGRTLTGPDLLRQHCVRCHGPEIRKSDLRLDSAAGLRAGGRSGRRLVSQSPADSELLRRLLPTAGSERMPPVGRGLTPAELQTIQQWIMAGAPWPATDKAPAAGPSGIGRFAALMPTLTAVQTHSRRSLVTAVVLAVAVLVLERLRRRHRWPLLRRFSRSHYFTALLALLLVGLAEYHVGVVGEQHAAAARLQQQLDAIYLPQILNGEDEFGPVPRRARHPNRISGEYYRGNDERDKRLFNGGFYRTATLRVFLADDTGHRLAYGQAVPAGPVFLTFELDRAPGTTAAHFTPHAMSSVFLSRQSYATTLSDEPVPLTIIRPDWSWAARYRIAASAAADDRMRGRIFVYCSASVRNNRLSGRIHYAIDYDIRLAADGTVADTSDLRMGSLFQTERVLQTPDDRIPATEWFDFRPIPEIVGENSTDPRLLGIGSPDGQ